LHEDPIQVMFNGPVAPMRALVVALRSSSAADRFAVAVTEYEHRDFALIDVNAAGCSKGTTLATWTAAHGITPDQVLAAGDNLNDLEMLTFAGTAVVMGNASPALLARADPRWLRAPTNDEGGLGAAITQLL
jgi:hydroxymethylpyrimidine pyrophosphatase-like HAD family hydrolase